MERTFCLWIEQWFSYKVGSESMDTSLRKANYLEYQRDPCRWICRRNSNKQAVTDCSSGHIVRIFAQAWHSCAHSWLGNRCDFILLHNNTAHHARIRSKSMNLFICGVVFDCRSCWRQVLFVNRSSVPREWRLTFKALHPKRSRCEHYGVVLR